MPSLEGDENGPARSKVIPTIVDGSQVVVATPVTCSRSISQYIADCVPFYPTSSSRHPLFARVRTPERSPLQGHGDDRSEISAKVNQIWSDTNICSSMRTACEYGPMFAGARRFESCT